MTMTSRLLKDACDLLLYAPATSRRDEVIKGLQALDQPAQAGWQPIPASGSLTFPNDEAFFVKNEAGYIGAATYVTKDGRAVYQTPEGEISICSGVTHWMPAP